MTDLFPFGVFFTVFFVGLLLQGRKVCPDCKEPLPFFQSPFTKNARQWWEGGWVCPNCGCESDILGKKVAAGTPPQRRSIILGISMLALAIVPAVILGGILVAYPHSTPVLQAAPVLHPAPPVQAAPVLRVKPESLSR